MRGEQNLRDGDRRNVTVLFADMKDFTSRSERMDPEEIDALMTRVFTTFEAIIRRYGGTVEKYIGDALVAVFGVPSIHEDDSERAVNAALDILDETRRLNVSTLDDIAPVGFRIGVHTGLITTGRRGEHHVVTGHAMSVASRLQAEADVNTVLVSEETRKSCDAGFIFSGPRPLSLKGKKDDIVAFAVTGRNPRPVDDDSVFVDREELLDAFLRDYLHHEPTRPGGILLTGEAGIGKSRLAAQFIAKCRQLPDFHSPVLYARAMRYRPRSFAAVSDILTGYFGLDPGADPDSVEAAVRAHTSVEPKTAAGVAELLSGTTKSHDNEAFVLLYLALKDIIADHAAGPYAPILVVENLHFMDRQSRDFFRFFIRNAGTKPFFLLTDRDPDPGIREVFATLQSVELEPLDREDATQLIREMCPSGLTPDTLNSILENSRGNPLFIREYVRFAAENRETPSLPTTIQNIFLTKIDPYEPPMRDVLKKLSVFAHSFSSDDAAHVQRMTDGDTRLVEPALSFFVRESILVREGPLFMFRHDVFKNALYDSLLNYNKRILHRIIAELMVSKGDPHPMRLLLHLTRAGEYHRALTALWNVTGLAGNLDYLPYIDILLDRLGDADLDAHLSLLFVKAAVLFNNGMTDEADAMLQGIIDEAIARRNALYAGSAYHLLTAHNMKAYCFEKARFCGTSGLAYYREAGARARRVQNLMTIMATAEMLRNRADEADRIIRLVETDDEFRGEPELATELQIFKADRLVKESKYREARSQLGSAIAELPRESEPWSMAHLTLATADFNLCDWDQLVRTGLTVLESPSRNYGNISRINAQIAAAHHSLGDEKAAVRRLQQAEFSRSQVRNEFDLLDACRTLSECHLITGEHDRARELARAAVTIGVRHSATYPLLTVLMILTELALGESDTPEARFYLSEARLLLARDVLLRNRDIALYYYFQSLTVDDPDEAEAARRAARQALTRELENIGEPKLIAAFMRTRSYGRVIREVVGDVAGMEAVLDSPEGPCY